ncbi:MAG: putative Ig domain-containing protein [Planctomycetota bacterium]|nr:putative Ig domain-containing protein [Planctomycetota bacterium]
MEPPACQLPALGVVTGADSDKVASDMCMDLGTAVVGRQFTRRINVRDGFPPYEFSLVTPLPDNSTLVIDSATGVITGTLRAPTPDAVNVMDDPGTPLVDESVPVTVSCLPQVVTFMVRIQDNNPDTLFDDFTFTFCMTIAPIDQATVRIEEATNVDTLTPPSSPPATFIGEAPGMVVFPPGPPFPDNSNDGLVNDLPSGLQRQPYRYQLHANGGNIFGGTPVLTTFNPVDSDDLSNFPGWITPNSAGIFSATNGPSTYTFTADDRFADFPTTSDPVLLDLVVRSTNDFGLPGSTEQVFLDVFDPTYVPGVPTIPVSAFGSLCVGSQGIIVNLANPLTATLPPDPLDPQDTVHDGDQWTITYDAFTDPLVAFELDPDSPPLPEGMTLSSTGLIGGTPSRAGDYTFLVLMIKTNPDTGEEEERITQQLFIHIEAGPVTSQFVIQTGSINLDFGRTNADSLRFTMYVAKDLVNSPAQLDGATLEVSIGQQLSDVLTPFHLSEHILGGSLNFGGRGINWPPKTVPGQPANLYFQDARVLVQPLNPNNGLMKIFVSNVNLKDAIGAGFVAFADAIEVPITISITGGPANLNLTFDEVVTFDYTQRANRGILTTYKGPLGATLGIGQFMVNSARGRIVFDPPTGSDTLDMTLSGFIRAADRLPIDFSDATFPVPAGHTKVLSILMGGQCVMQLEDPSGTVGFKQVGVGPDTIVIRPPKTLAVDPHDRTGISQFIINNRTGTFTLRTVAPAVNAAKILGSPDPGGLIGGIADADPGYVILPNFLFEVNLVIRLTDRDDTVMPPTETPINSYDFRYNVVLFRKGNTIGLR